MLDTRFNDIACKLRRLAESLEKQAQDHRKAADQMDHITASAPPANTPPPHIAALDRAANELINLPAAQIRIAAPKVARKHGLDVFGVALRAKHLRAMKAKEQRKADTITVMTALSQGKTLKQAGDRINASEATARRYRDAWAKV